MKELVNTFTDYLFVLKKCTDMEERVKEFVNTFTDCLFVLKKCTEWRKQ